MKNYKLYDDVLDTLKYSYIDVISSNGEDFKRNYSQSGLKYPLKQIKNDIKILEDGLKYDFNTLLDISLNGRKAEDILIDIGYNAIISLYMFSKQKNMKSFIDGHSIRGTILTPHSEQILFCSENNTESNKELEKQHEELNRSDLVDE